MRYAKGMNCKLAMSLRSQFFHNRRHFSSQPKLRSTSERPAVERSSAYDRENERVGIVVSATRQTAAAGRLEYRTPVVD